MVLSYIGNSMEWYPKLGISVDKGWVDEVDDKKSEMLLSTKKFVVIDDKHLYDKEIKQKEVVEPLSNIGE